MLQLELVIPVWCAWLSKKKKKKEEARWGLSILGIFMLGQEEEIKSEWQPEQGEV